MCLVYQSISNIYIFNLMKFSCGKPRCQKYITNKRQTVTPTFSTSLTKAGEHKLKENSFNLWTRFTKPNQKSITNQWGRHLALRMNVKSLSMVDQLEIQTGVKQPLQMSNPTNTTIPNNATKVEEKQSSTHTYTQNNASILDYKIEQSVSSKHITLNVCVLYWVRVSRKEEPPHQIHFYLINRLTSHQTITKQTEGISSFLIKKKTIENWKGRA